MKYLKLYESEEVRMLNNILPYLSKDKLEESIELFDSILNNMRGLVENYNVSFSTAYGARCGMSYDDYNEKNSKYEVFINGFPVMGYKLEIRINIDKCDIDLVSEIMSGDYYEFISRTDGILKHRRTEIVIKPLDNVLGNKMYIIIELGEDR